MDNESQETWNQRWSRAVERSWSDAAFKKRLLSDPREALRDAGVEIPANVQVNIAEDSESLMNLVIPPSPAHLSIAQLGGVAGGTSLHSALSLRLYVSPWLNAVKFYPSPPS
jgi:hypothetical protein